MTKQKKQVDAGAIGAVVFGSDQGLVGQFNDVVADYAIKTLAALPANPRSGPSVSAFMRAWQTEACAGGPLRRAEFRQGDHATRWADSNRKRSASRQRRVCACLRLPQPSEVWALYEPVSQRLLPLDAQWLQGLARSLAERDLPEVMGGGTATLRALIREYLFISLFRACAESLASEEREPPGGDAGVPTRNIDELLEQLKGHFIVCAKTASTRNCSTSSPASEALSKGETHPVSG